MDVGFDLERHVREIERRFIIEALRRTNDVKVKAAGTSGHDLQVVSLRKKSKDCDRLSAFDVRRSAESRRRSKVDRRRPFSSAAFRRFPLTVFVREPQDWQRRDGP
jgi:hypothetical protein